METSELKDRIKQVRKEQKKSQAAFGADLGCSRDAIANYEGGRADPPETFLQLLCSKFGIQEEWLRTGEGKKQVNEEDTFLKRLADRYHLPPAQDRLLRAWLHLKPADREHFLAIMRELVSTADDEERRPAGIDIEQETADYRAELEAQERARSLSAGTSATEETEKRA